MDLALHCSRSSGEFRAAGTEAGPQGGGGPRPVSCAQSGRMTDTVPSIVTYTGLQLAANRYPNTSSRPRRRAPVASQRWQTSGRPKRMRAGCTSTGAAGSAALPSGSSSARSRMRPWWSACASRWPARSCGTSQSDTSDPHRVTGTAGPAESSAESGACCVPIIRHPEKEARTLGWGPSGTVSSSSGGAPTKPDHMTGQAMGVPKRTHTGGVL